MGARRCTTSVSLALSNTSPVRAARQTSSARVSEARPSPSAMRTSAARAPASSGSGLPSIVSARANSLSIAAASSERQERVVELDRWVLGGRADEDDGAVLHHGEEGILLGAVEAVHLVDEQKRALAGLAPRAGGVEHLLEVGDAGKDRGNLLELQVGGVSQQPRHGGLAGAGRAPEDERAERARLQHASERAVLAEQMVLADHVREPLRPQTVGERPRRVALEAGSGEQIGRGGGLPGHETKVAPIGPNRKRGQRGANPEAAI